MESKPLIQCSQTGLDFNPASFADNLGKKCFHDVVTQVTIVFLSGCYSLDYFLKLLPGFQLSYAPEKCFSGSKAAPGVV